MSVVIPDDLVVSVSGFRGRVGYLLAPELVYELATAYGAFVKRSADARSAQPVDILIGKPKRLARSSRRVCGASSTGVTIRLAWP